MTCFQTAYPHVILVLVLKFNLKVTSVFQVILILVIQFYLF